ncbi:MULTISPECIES: glycosyltransferase family 39 protein [Nonomuraea]|uniref:Glycosyltransferase family 39 protein n=1 Tax=Nonomuraea ferruginea TaxID=46174 RepID=A0ABT4SY45_9ACTN|nr:glycosyltransferase family 39 protein [Nonomuraea ferruginea]MDA0641795.1 glycosyltransferase family 39 protein [Nonomuraea ferruginea]
MDSPLAWRPVTAVSAVLVTLLLALSPRYGYHRDELYFRALADYPDWGYVDQPPFTPMAARLSMALFGDSPTALRVLPALAAALLVVLTALIARELGGGGAAQTLTAAGTATGAYTLIAGHTLLTASFDLPIWAAAILFMLKALLRDERWWLAAGAVIGAATYNKLLIVMLVLGLAAGLLAAGPRRLLASKWLWAGALVAAVLALPNFVYQLTHDWPQLKMAAGLSEGDGDTMRLLFTPMQLLLFGPVVAVIAGFGFVRLWRDRRVRALAVAYPAAAVVTVISGGRFDYTAGLVLLLFAAGCVTAESAGREKIKSAGLSLAVNGLGNAVITLPLVPLTMLASTPVPLINEVARESIGWPAFNAAVTGVLDSLPPDERRRAVVVTGNYGEHGSLVQGGLTRVYSGHNQLWEYGPPPDDGDPAIIVNVGRMRRDLQYSSCEVRARVDNGLGLDNEEQDMPVFLCQGLRQPWTATWHRWQQFD